MSGANEGQLDVLVVREGGTAIFWKQIMKSNLLMIRVWNPTPWVINVFTRDRDDEIRAWCEDNFGQESSPIHKQDGAWHMGGATVDGWTWMGFHSEELMRRFEAAFPSHNTDLSGAASASARKPCSAKPEA